MEEAALLAYLLQVHHLAQVCVKALTRFPNSPRLVVNEVYDVRSLIEAYLEAFKGQDSTYRVPDELSPTILRLLDSLQGVRDILEKVGSIHSRRRLAVVQGQQSRIQEIHTQLQEDRRRLQLYLNLMIPQLSNTPETQVTAYAISTGKGLPISVVEDSARPSTKQTRLLAGIESTAHETLTQPMSKHLQVVKHVAELSSQGSICSCKCHDMLRVRRTPSWTFRLWGTLLIVDMLERHCRRRSCTNLESCNNIPPIFVRLEYTFPPWLTARAVSVSMQLQPWGSIFTLHTSRILPSDSLGFLCCKDGDLDSLRGLLESRRISLHDTDPTGNTLLHVSIESNNERTQAKSVPGSRQCKSARNMYFFATVRR